MTAPLGPIRAIKHGAYIDRYGNEYNSIEHVLRCVIAKELDLVART